MTISARLVVVLSLISAISIIFMLQSFRAPLPQRTHHTWLESIFSSDVNNDVTIQAPHIVFILADDLSWNALGGFDSESDIAFAAPGLAALAAQGIKMTNYYAQELCTPSRAALLTGRYPVSMGMQFGTVLASKPWGMPLDETTIAEGIHSPPPPFPLLVIVIVTSIFPHVHHHLHPLPLPQPYFSALSLVLRDAGGYATHAVGKWHVGHHSASYLPTARGFNTFTGYLDGENNYFSKHDPKVEGFRDFMVSDTTCFYAYNK